MHRWALFSALTLNLISFSAWGLNPLTACKVLPSKAPLPIEEVGIQLLGQDRVRVHFKMTDENTSDECKIIQEDQSETLIRCLSPHGLIELVVKGQAGTMKLRAVGRSGRIFKATASLSCE